MRLRWSFEPRLFAWYDNRSRMAGGVSLTLLGVNFEWGYRTLDEAKQWLDMQPDDDPVEELATWEPGDITTSNFYDFSSRIAWDYVWQAIRYRDVSFYWDKKNHAYCRRIKNVQGQIWLENGELVFKPICHPLVSYSQLVSGWN